jgi:rod shape-determining protein MreC
VISRGSSSTFSQTVTLDAGSAKGIYPDMTVISDGGIVGVVKAVTRSSSIVLLMSDPTFKVGVRIAGTQSAGVLIGQGSSKYLLQLLDANGTINVGDSLVTLGSDNNRPFVPGVPVGKVVKVSTTSASVTQEALVEGFSNLNALGVVSVILSTSGKDLKDQLLPSPPATRSPVPSPTPSVKPTPGASKKA